VILLLISGVGLWFVESIPWSLCWLCYLSVTVHVTAALATIGGFIIHVYMGTAMGAAGSLPSFEERLPWLGRRRITGFATSRSRRAVPRKNNRHDPHTTQAHLA
jgi:hypothetical protein